VELIPPELRPLVGPRKRSARRQRPGSGPRCVTCLPRTHRWRACCRATPRTR